MIRAVRLLPDVVKIGIEREPALASDYGEEQAFLSIDENLSKKEGNLPVSSQPEEEQALPLKELQNLLAELEEQLKAAKAKEQVLAVKVSSLEAEISAVKSECAQKERDFTNNVNAAKAQARAEGMGQGHEEGLQKGYNDGLAKAQAEVEEQYRGKFSSIATTLEGMSASIEKQFAELVELNQPRMLRLWQGMLKKMLLHEMKMTPDGIFKVLADVLSRLSDKNHVLIYVSPEDIGLLENRLDGEFGDILRGVKHLELKPDAHVDKGSCLVETNLGVYDARWRTQFEQIDSVVESLFQKLGKPPQAKVKEKRERTVKKDVKDVKKDQKKVEPDKNE